MMMTVVNLTGCRERMDGRTFIVGGGFQSTRTMGEWAYRTDFAVLMHLRLVGGSIMWCKQQLT